MRIRRIGKLGERKRIKKDQHIMTIKTQKIPIIEKKLLAPA